LREKEDLSKSTVLGVAMRWGAWWIHWWLNKNRCIV